MTTRQEASGRHAGPGLSWGRGFTPRPTAARAAAAALVVLSAAGGVELAGRSVARGSMAAQVVGAAPSDTAVAAVAIACAAGALLAAWAARRLTPDRAAACVLIAAFAAGMAAQLHLGARLQSDGFYYYAHLRSLWFDHDQDLTNDYRMLGLGGKTHLFTPTPTGYAQSAWTIGPSIVWSPFFGAGHLVAGHLHAAGQDVAVDGTSFPYRQAVCVAGLVWGLLGLYCCYRFAALVAAPAWAAAAAALVGGGSFLLWYLVKEPSMTHAPSMAAVAAFTWAWAATRGRRTRVQWALLGLAAGFMGTIRWQNVLFALLPAIEWLLDAAALARDPERRRQLPPALVDGLAFTGMAVAGFAPQLLVWKAIYGQYFAVSPIGPQIRLLHPRIVDALWSAQNGLLATSPVLYLGIAGLLLLWRRDRRLAAGALAACAAMTWFNASIQDWWGSAAFGGRRFDGVLPLLVLGTAVCLPALKTAVERHATAVVALAAAALVVYNATFMAAALTGRVRIGEPIDFPALAGYQAAAVERAVGHPFSWPASLVFAVRHGVSPADYDGLWAFRFFADPARPYGRIDVGQDDDRWMGEGWYAPEREGDATFRWADRIGSLRIALDHPADLRVQVRLRAFRWNGAPDQQLVIAINGHPQPALPVPPDWAVVEQQVDRSQWETGINHTELRFAHARRPVDVGAGGDPRALAAAVDYVRVAVAAP